MPAPQPFAARAFSFACQIVSLYVALLRVPQFPFGIARQLLRSGTSIGANLEEAKSASSRRDLLFRFQASLREARETKYWLRLIVATNLAPPGLVNEPLREVDELVAILTKSVQRLRSGNPYPVE